MKELKRYSNPYIITVFLLVNVYFPLESFGQSANGISADTVEIDSTEYSIAMDAMVRSRRVTRFNSGIFSDPYLLIQGRVAGTSIYNRGGNPNMSSVVRVRGLSGGSFRQPLVVVDGVPGLSIDLIDPLEISSLTVLKDAGSQAAYGIRGTDGVLLVETKTSQWQRDTLQVGYLGQIGATQRVGLDPLLSPEEFKSQGGLDLGSATDWQDAITRQTQSFSHALSFTGRKGKTNYRLSGSYRSLQGILQDSGHDRYNANLQINSSFFGDRLTLNFRSAYTYRDIGFGFPEAFQYAASFNPTAPILAEGLPFEFIPEDYGGYFQFIGLYDAINPLSIIELNQRQGLSEIAYNSLHLKFELKEGLFLNARHSRQNSFSNQRSFYSPFSIYNPWDSFDKGTALLNDVDDDIAITEVFMDFNKKKDAFELDVNLGAALQKGRFEDRRIHLSLFDEVQQLQTKRIGAVEPWIDNFELSDSSFNGWNNNVVSYYGNANVNIREKVNLFTSLRVDGSSKLGINRQWGTFYSIGLHANLGKIFDWKDLDQLVFTSMYGVTGGLPERGGLSSARYFIYYDPIFEQNDTIQSGQANPYLKWEGKKEVTLGVQMRKGRMRIGVDWYKKFMSDWISEDYGEFYPFYSNQFGMNGMGIDAYFEWDILESVHGKLTTGGYLSWYTSRISNVRNGHVVVPCACGLYPDPIVVLENESPLGQIYAPIFTGELDNRGQPIFADLNGNGILETNSSFIGQDADLADLGSGIPSIETGWTFDYSYKSWQFSTLIRGAFGHKLINIKRQILERFPDTDRPIVFNSLVTPLRVEGLRSTRFSSLYVESANFVKWDNLTISRHFDFKIGNRKKLLTLSITANNLVTLSSYSGLDPEPALEDNNLLQSDAHPWVFGETNRNAFLLGIDRPFSYIPARSFVFSVQLGI